MLEPDYDKWLEQQAGCWDDSEAEERDCELREYQEQEDCDRYDLERELEL